MADIDLTSPGSTTTIDGVIVTYGDPIGSGTGIYEPFLGLNDNDGDEEGFNNDQNHVLDTDQSKTSSLTFNDVPIKIIDGVEYFEFRLDLNQENADPDISLTSLKLYYSGAPATAADYIAATSELDSDFTKVFDLDGGGDTTLLLTAHSSGSGNDDYVFFVPVSAFDGADFSTDFITLYADFGSPGTDFAANDGFEEFNTEKVSTIDGVKFGDTDGDGVMDAGEVGLAGWTVFIDGNENGVLDTGERSTVTAADGTFQFAGVGTSLESVRIDEVLQAGWVQTTGDYETVDVSTAGNYSVQIGNFLPNPALNITKDATVPGGTANWAGEVISYTISVANTGNVALTGVTVTDPFVSNLAPVLVSGFNSGDLDQDNALDLTETWHYTATHTVTQAEIDAGGTIDNIATADSDQTGPDTDPASVPVEQNPALNITKDASVPGGTADWAGELISYTISVANTGNLTLTGLTVTDPFADVGSIVRGADTVGDNDALLEVGETWSYTAAHTVTQAEIDSNGGGDGALENTATADSSETGPDTDDASVPVYRNPALNITKDASVPGGTADAAGELISYTISVANTGNTTLSGVTVTDPFADVGSIVRGTDTVGDNDALLEVGETWSYTAAHTVTQAEIDSNGGGDGALENTATADSEETGSDTDDASVPVEQRPSLNITKDASVPGGTADAAGELISYTISVANTGNTTLTGVTVTDPFADVGSIVRGADTVGDNDALLEVGETWSYTAAHTVTQAEIDSNGDGDGALENTATADSEETGPDTDDASVPVGRNPALNITKDASVPGGTADTAGELISYAISVANTGNTTLTGVTVTDPFADVGSIVRGTDTVGDNDALLEVGETWSYTAAHTVTQAEIDSNGDGDGLLQNTATADSEETGPDTDDANVPVEQRPGLNVTKDASVPGGTADTAGELISYTISVANTGNMTLTGVTLTDPFADVGSIIRGADTVGDDDNLLEVGETWSYTATHSVTQADLDSNGGGDGALENTATADSSETGEDTDDASVPVEQRASIDIEKFVSIDGGLTWDDADDPQGPVATSGADIQFKFVVSNTGNVSLTDAMVTDSVFDLNGADPGTAMSLGTLDVGETNTFYYDATWAAGQHVNNATATGDYSEGQATDSDLAYYFGLIDCVGVRTPGFWSSPNGLTFWDGTVGNETKSGPNFADGELLAYNNSITDGPDGGTSNLQERYILLGDDDGDGVTDAGEDTLKVSLDLALKIIDASQKTQQDARWVLARDAVATWLNFEAGNPSGDPTDTNSPAHKMDLAIDWLQQYADNNNDGVLDFNGQPIKQSNSAWSGSGSGLHSALDEYNNFGTVNGEHYACDADDHLFVDALARYHEDVLA
jgi:uncharacterized repeat protein (TIGR01451 family)